MAEVNSSKPEQVNQDFLPRKTVYDPDIDTKLSDQEFQEILVSLSGKVIRGEFQYNRNLHNLGVIAREDKVLAGVRYNQLTHNIEIHGKPTWYRDDTLPLWTDVDTVGFRDYIAFTYEIDFAKADVADAVHMVAMSRQYHPIKQYLQSLPPWDGISRIDSIFIDYFGAADNPYTRDVARKWILAAIKRIYEPGCKYDNVPVLSGPQGIGKSTFFKRLGKNWFSDSLTFTDMADVKKAAEKIKGTWINEISELNGIRKQDIGTVKNFISSSQDIYRAAYAKSAEPNPRQCVLIGTTNDDNFLFDDTGNRRFQPIRVTGEGRYNPTKISDKTVDQIWAEGLALFQHNPDVELQLNPLSEAFALQAQMDALESSELEGVIGYYLDMELPDDWESVSIMSRRMYFQAYNPKETQHGCIMHKRTSVCIPEIWCECLGEPLDRLTRAASLNISRCLTKLHWVPGKGKNTLEDGSKNPFPERQNVARYGQSRMRYRYEDMNKTKENPESGDTKKAS